MAVAEGRLDVANVNQHVVLRRPAKAKATTPKKAAAKKAAPKTAPKPEPEAVEVEVSDGDAAFTVVDAWPDDKD